MLKNYFKLAIKVLGRRKFFTFISLFGISFTLMILMLITSFFNTELGTYPPISQKDKMVFLNRMQMRTQVNDTIPEVDSVFLDGKMTYDTTYSYTDRFTSTSTSPVGYAFLDQHMRELPSATLYSFYTRDHTYDVFVNSKKLTLNVMHCDAPYWNIFDFKFLQGRPFNGPEVDNQSQVAVLTAKTCEEYFGTAEGAVGKEIVFDNKHFQVIGVIKMPNSQKDYTFGDIYTPITNLPAAALNNPSFRGGYRGVFLADSPDKRDQIKAEIEQKSQSVTFPEEDDQFNYIKVTSYNFMEAYASDQFFADSPQKSKNYLFIALLLVLLFLTLLPTLNLININISRIMERSAEIGVRKAFGAHSGNILIQFVFENVILTLIGGFIGLILAWIAIYLLNDSQLLGDNTLLFNFQVFFYSLLISLVFGVLSGLIPAYKMSKIQISNALKQNQL